MKENWKALASRVENAVMRIIEEEDMPDTDRWLPRDLLVFSVSCSLQYCLLQHKESALNSGNVRCAAVPDFPELMFHL